MSPRTPLLIPVAGALALLTACGAPPQPQHTSPPYAPPSASAAPLTLPPATVPPLPTITATATYPTYTPLPTTTPTTATPTTRSPTPTPSHAGRCTGEPTGAQILALLTEENLGIPPAELRVAEGPFCSATWSFTTVAVAGRNDKEEERLWVVATGKGTTLDPVAIGSDVCVDRVQTAAPPGIRVLACGF